MAKGSKRMGFTFSTLLHAGAVALLMPVVTQITPFSANETEINLSLSSFVEQVVPEPVIETPEESVEQEVIEEPEPVVETPEEVVKEEVVETPEPIQPVIQEKPIKPEPVIAKKIPEKKKEVIKQKPIAPVKKVVAKRKPVPKSTS
ncbi:hypothetical protein [Solemya elarraichensis gill symbiont]|uniref:Uncharacterized protein n=1 Tax=Solemya elarraichensis gill symbiont TaxID=1918949 RepID=A0A1T2KZI0_9GAMM|nr:hypothetical protein [Solemya elarraichensis gill symbiont]OOZ38249.1 hypothetical protein BOW52_08950 [Solemya elarraichensis gill symbiont]